MARVFTFQLHSCLAFYWSFRLLQGNAHIRADLPGPEARAPAQHSPPRSQVSEHFPDEKRGGQARRLRDRSGVSCFFVVVVELHTTVPCRAICRGLNEQLL